MKLFNLPKMLRDSLSRFLRSASGSVVVQFAMVSPVLLGISGLAIDFGTYEMKVARLQTAVDASVLGATKELVLAGASDDDVRSVVNSYLAINLEGSGSTVSSKVGINRKAGSLRIELQEEWTPAFAQFLNADVTPIRVDAMATLTGYSNICILTLDSAAARSIHLDNSANLKANGCVVYSNSTAPQGIRLDLDSSMKARSICSAGGYKATTTALAPLPTTDCPPISDPLEGRNAPVDGGCDKTAYKVSSGANTLLPGTYCGGIKIGGTASVTFMPGNYIIKDGKFTVSDNARIVGEHVGFYLQGEKTLINFIDDASVSLTGSISGDMAGLLFLRTALRSIVSTDQKRKCGCPNGHDLLPQGHTNPNGMCGTPRTRLQLPFGRGEDPDLF